MIPIQYSSPSRAQTRILILSEDSDLVHLLSGDVARLGLQAEQGTISCIRAGMLNATTYNGIIIDLDINPSTCLGVIRDLHVCNPDIPIVVIGEQRRKYDLFFGLIGGATDFLVKPIDSVLLKRKCLRLFL